MPITVKPKLKELEVNAGDRPYARQGYILTGDSVYTNALLALIQQTQQHFDLGGGTKIPRVNVFIEPLGETSWHGVVEWGVARIGGGSGTESTFNFTTMGGTKHISASEQITATAGQPPDNDTLIGATADGVDGTDITVPIYGFSETHAIPFDVVTNGYKRLLMQMTGRVNLGSWRGYTEGEVLFLGATGSKREFGLQWDITYNFAAEESQNILVDTTTIFKRGWNLLEVFSENTFAVGRVFRSIIGLRTHQIYKFGAFSALGIGV